MSLLENIIKYENKLIELWTQVGKRLEFIVSKFESDLDMFDVEFTIGPHEHSYLAVDQRESTYHDMGLVVEFRNLSSNSRLAYRVSFRAQDSEYGKKGDLLLEMDEYSYDSPTSTYWFQEHLEKLNIDDLMLDDDALELKMYSLIHGII